MVACMATLVPQNHVPSVWVSASCAVNERQFGVMKNKKQLAATKRSPEHAGSESSPHNSKTGPKIQESPASTRTYTICDYRLEKPTFTCRQVRTGDTVRYEVESGDLSKPAPPIRESKYLSRQQVIEIYRWMLLNRRMETAL